MRIGIGITTRNRADVLEQTLIYIKKHAPRGAKIVLVDDSSDVPFNGLMVDKGISSYRFTERAGIARAKNKCLEMLSDCEHIFLFDDDCYPIKSNWWKPYVKHKEPHLMYCFKLSGKPKTDMRELSRDKNTVQYSHTRGAMLYVDRKILDVVGGMDTEYKIYGFEHPDWTNRIHNAGLTSKRVMDVPDSNKLLYCLDQEQKVESTLTLKEKNKNYMRNASLYVNNRGSKEYKEFRW